MLALRVQPALQAAAAHLVRVRVRVRTRARVRVRVRVRAAAHQREDEARRLAREAVAEQGQQVRVRAAGEEGDLEEMWGR